jgi:hypothetical protein
MPTIGKSEDIPDVYCPFSGDGQCHAAEDIHGNPACPNNKERVCVNGLPGEDD